MLPHLKTKTYNFLRWTENWTKTDMVYLSKGSFWTSINQTISAILFFISSIALANFIPKDIFGQYKYILSFVSLLSITTLPGLTASLTQAISRGYEGSILTAIKTRVKWGALGTVIGLLLSLYYYYNNDNTLAILFLIISLFLPFYSSFNVYNCLLNGRKKFKESSYYSIINTAIYIGLFILVLYCVNNILIILLYYFISQLFLSIIFYLLITKKHKPNDRIDKNTIQYGKFLSFVSILSAISAVIDKIITWHFLGATQLAIYSFAIMPVNLIKGFINSNIGKLAIPKLSNTNLSILQKTLPLKVIKFVLVLIPIVIIYIIVSPNFFNIFYSSYEESVSYSQLYSLVILSIPFTMFGNSLIAKTKKKKISFLTVVSPTFRIILFIVLIPSFGINGIIMSHLLGSVFHAILSYTIFKF